MICSNNVFKSTVDSSISFGIYQNWLNSRIVHLAKASGVTDQKMVNITNMNHFSIDKPRELSLKSTIDSSISFGISITILTKNSQKHLRQVLEAVQAFDNVIVADTGSTDDTLSIAKGFPNVTLLSVPFEGFGPTHNVVSAYAKYDWIFSIDSDEIVTPELKEELLHHIQLHKDQVYSVWRKNIYRGKHIKGCGWYPDRVVRLYHRGKTQFSDDLVHEKVVTDHCAIVELQSPLIHLPFEGTSDFLRKMATYSTLYAQQRPTAKASLVKAVAHAFYAFAKSYFFQRGWLLGVEGFEVSWYNMNCAFYKYAKIRENSIGS